jgi:hypothetical protein
VIDIAAVQVGRLQTRDDFGGTVDRHYDVDIARRRDVRGALHGKRDLQSRRADDNNVVPDVGEHVSRLRQ